MPSLPVGDLVLDLPTHRRGLDRRSDVVAFLEPQLSYGLTGAEPEPSQKNEIYAWKLPGKFGHSRLEQLDLEALQ